MTKEELGQSLNLKERLIPEGNENRSGRLLRPTKIAIHNTGNTDRGADAVAHSRHLIQNAGDSGYGPTSWHYTIDDSCVVKHLPLGEKGMHAHASGNGVSLGIEMCMNSDGDWAATVDRAARVVAVLCFDFGWDILIIKQHHDFPRANGTRKNCPSRLRAGHDGITWQSFITLAKSYLNNSLDSEGFVNGFSISKEVASSDEGMERVWTSIGDDFDQDHGEIVIPQSLLNLRE